MERTYSEGYVGGAAKIMAPKPQTAAQKKAAKLGGAKRQFRLGIYVCAGTPAYACGNVKGYRVKGKEVQIKINDKWYPKYMVTKNPIVMKAIKRMERKPK